MSEKLKTLIGEYWDCAYQQGLEHREHDDEAGTAQRLHYEIKREELYDIPK
jgi:hypothetical protein